MAITKIIIFKKEPSVAVTKQLEKMGLTHTVNPDCPDTVCAQLTQLTIEIQKASKNRLMIATKLMLEGNMKNNVIH